jgi:Uma2 family endonuclease
MTTELAATETTTGTLNVKFRINGSPLQLPDNGMTREEFYQFCLTNNELRIERTADGQIIIMPPTGSETGIRNSEIHTDIAIWNRLHKLGFTFDSSTGFTMEDGAERSADTAWILKERWEALPLSERKRFARITPDFVLELRSEDQSMPKLREKMEEFMENGCRLAWLIDPQNRRTLVYTVNGEIQTVSFDEVLTGADVMPGLELKLADII